MASELQVDELKGVTADGDITITSEGGAATMQLQQGLIKSWLKFEQIGTHETKDSFNISSVTDEATGRTDPISFTNNMNNANYSGCMYQNGYDPGDGSTTNTGFNNHYAGGLGDYATGSVGMGAHNNSGFVDANNIQLSVWGDLA